MEGGLPPLLLAELAFEHTETDVDVTDGLLCVLINSWSVYMLLKVSRSQSSQEFFGSSFLQISSSVPKGYRHICLFCRRSGRYSLWRNLSGFLISCSRGLETKVSEKLSSVPDSGGMRVSTFMKNLAILEELWSNCKN